MGARFSSKPNEWNERKKSTIPTVGTFFIDIIPKAA